MRMNLTSAGGIEGVLAEHFWAYMYFVDNMVQLVGGRGGPGGFGTMGGIDTDFGLLGGSRSTFGVVIRPLGTNDIQIGANVKGYGNAWDSRNEVEQTWIGFGVMYRMPDLFQGVVNFRTHYRDMYGGASHGVPSDGAWDIAAGVNVLALADLGITRLAVDFALENMDHMFMKKDNNGNADLTDLKIGQRIEYTNGDLNAGLRARQSFLLGVDTAEEKEWDWYAPTLSFAAHVQYTMDSLVPRLDAGFIMNGQPATNFRRGWDAVSTGFSLNEESQWGMNKYAMGLALAPSLRMNMTRSWIEFGYTMSYDMSKEMNDKGQGVFEKDYKGTRLRNMIYIDFQVSF